MSIQPGVPLAAAILFEADQPGADTPQIPGPDPGPDPALPELPPFPPPSIPPLPLFKPCNLGFKDGCYAVTFHPTGALRPLVGTLRIDRVFSEAGPGRCDRERRPLPRRTTVGRRQPRYDARTRHRPRGSDRLGRGNGESC